MIRLRCTTEDLLNVTIAEHPSPLAELALALMTLQRRDADPLFGRWRTRLAQTLPDQAKPIFQLVSPLGVGPRFLDPPSRTTEEGLELVMSTPRAEATAELQRLCAIDRPRTLWVRQLAQKDKDAWQTLHQAIRTAHNAVLRDAWPRLSAGFYAETTWRTRILAQQGLRATLTGLAPSIRMVGHTLEIPNARNLDLTWPGRGIILQPSLLWPGHPLATWYPDGRVMLIYPALTPLPLQTQTSSTDPLAVLLGTTRAQTLRLLTRPHTTSQLAKELTITPAAASMQTKTLREAGLITSQRDGKAIWHACTPLGHDLLNVNTGRI